MKKVLVPGAPVWKLQRKRRNIAAVTQVVVMEKQDIREHEVNLKANEIA